MDHVHDSARTHGRAVAGGALVAAAGLLAALALVYTNATGVADVAADARLQQQTESALGAAASARNAVGQALLVSGSSEDRALVAAAVSEARSVVEAMTQRVQTVASNLAEPSQIEDDLHRVLADVTEVLDALTDGDIEYASQVATGASATSFGFLVADLAAQRDELASRIAGAATESGTVATASRFMVAFFVPSLGVAIAFVVARRRRKREWLAVELEQERALNQSKDQLIANLSHELRTPLTGIYTSALAIEDTDFADLELARELTDIIIGQSADLTRMVEDLLVSAQADAGRLGFELQPTQIKDLVAELGQEFGRLDTRIDVAIAPGVVLVDPGRLRQLFRNLVSNAAKYGNGVVGIKGRLEDGAYIVEVIDNGPGVPRDVETRMFERFVHRGDQPLVMGSVGLGLSISKVLAEGMGGRIAHRRADDLTIFEVTLERAARAELPPDPSPDSEPTLLADKVPETTH